VESAFSSRDLKNHCSATHPGSWDRSAALESVGGDETLLCEVIQAFLKESPNLVTRIEQALSLHDPRLLEIAAHSLKGALGYLGVPDAYRVEKCLLNCILVWSHCGLHSVNAPVPAPDLTVTCGCVARQGGVNDGTW
jgi:Hpt domain-containing protein